MAAQQVLVLGGGFAGLWSAVGAARKLDELGIGPDDITVTLVNADPYHSIRVRNYEADLSGVRVALDDVLAPIGVRREQALVQAIDPRKQLVSIEQANGSRQLAYDRLVIALGSQLVRPDVPGLAQFGFDIDTFDAASRLNAHLNNLARRDERPGLRTVVVVGAGLTGIEAATEMPAKLRAALDVAGVSRPFRVMLVDHQPHVGSDMGESARPVIEQALAALAIETRVGVRVTAVSDHDLTLASGEVIPTSTVVWCAGLRANPLAQSLAVPCDRWGRLPVDPFLRVEGVPHVFAAGDVAALELDAQHSTVMSCQFGRPMGRFAGHNVVCDLVGKPMLPLEIDWYVTVLDLGSWGAVYTEGWDRHVVAQGATAKRTKQTINCQRIYPPTSGIRGEILAAAAPVVERPPTYGR